jgi:diacylglycerol O-acyltransferase / wax synthase
VARVLFDQSPGSQPPGRLQLGPQPWKPAPSPPVHELVGDVLAERAATRLAVAAEALDDLVDPAAGIDRAARFLDGWSAQLDAATGPRWFRETSPLPVRFGLRAIEESPLRSAARSVGAGLDHVALTLAAGGISDLLAARGTRLGADAVIRTVVPVAVPRRSRREVLGNHAAYYIVPLPIGPMTPVERLQAIVAAAAAVRSRSQVETITTMLEGMNRLPAGSIAAAARSVSGSGAVDLVVSYMRGSREPQWSAGLPHVATHPMLPVGPFIRLMVGAVSLGGVLGLGVTADQAAVPELDFLLDRMVRTGARLAAAAG